MTTATAEEFRRRDRERREHVAGDQPLAHLFSVPLSEVRSRVTRAPRRGQPVRKTSRAAEPSAPAPRGTIARPGGGLAVPRPPVTPAATNPVSGAATPPSPATVAAQLAKARAAKALARK
jgi:hypothetical protein